MKILKKSHSAELGQVCSLKSRKLRGGVGSESLRKRKSSQPKKQSIPKPVLMPWTKVRMVSDGILTPSGRWTRKDGLNLAESEDLWQIFVYRGPLKGP